MENLSICLCSYKSNPLKILNPKNSWVVFRVKFVNFLKSRLIFNILCCFWMFVNNHFTYLTCTYLKKQKVLSCQIFRIFFHVNKKISTGFQIYISVPLRCISLRHFLFGSFENKSSEKYCFIWLISLMNIFIW